MRQILPLLGTLLLLAMAQLISPGAALADTVLPDTLHPVTGHTYIMTPEGSPYIGNVLTFIRRGDTLLVEAGTVARFGANGGLVVLGTMISRGDAAHLVRFTRDPSISTNWDGIKISPLGFPGDTTRCDFQYTKFSFARTAITTTQRAVPEGEQHCVTFNHCAFDSSSLGVVCYLPGRYQIQNCTFNEIRNFCIYTSESIVDIRNNVFMPSSNLPAYAHGILLWNTSWTPSDYIQYNCFYSGQNGLWINYIETYVDGDVFYTRVDPDSTHLLTDPMLDSGYYPEAGSPVVDAGDPTLLDPDLTRSDMGMHWFLGSAVPCNILSEEPSPRAWVRGYTYLGMIDIEAYPPAAWTLDGPPGLQVVQLNRNRLALSWPVDQQQVGQFPIFLRGVNEANQIIYHDSLEALLDFVPNHPPHLTFVRPCPSGDCLDQHVVVEDSLPAGDVVDVLIRYADEDAARLGPVQHKELNYLLNGVPRPTVYADSLSLSFALDTSRVELRMTFTDGLLSDSLDLSIVPRYSLLEGDISGVIGAQTGAVYLTGPLRVPVGAQLTIEAGSRIVAGDKGDDEWLLDVDGGLIIQGTAELPIQIRSNALHSDVEDRRPQFLRLKQGCQVSSISHLNLTGFSTAIQVEHVDQDLPLRIEDCHFSLTRVGVLSVGSPVEVRACRFDAPGDSLQLGSYGIYLADSRDCRVQNNLFINPIVGLQTVDAEALVANNSFLLLLDQMPYHWPLTGQLGFGRVQILNSTIDLRNNLFQWREPYFFQAFAENDIEDFVDNAPRGVWLDPASQVRSEYNWFDCLNGWMIPSDTSATGLVNMMHLMAFNDSTLLITDIRAGLDSARVDRQHDFHLFADSPLIDAGDPNPTWNDAFDDSRCDIGWRGGPLASENEYTPVAGHEAHLPPHLAELPQRFRLRPPWPNPFNPVTRLEIELDRAGLLDLRVFDLLGREVAVLARGTLEAGLYQFSLDAGAWASGSYFARARFEGEEQTQRLLLIK